MSDEIVTRLRELAENPKFICRMNGKEAEEFAADIRALLSQRAEAAERIERLEKENAEFRHALGDIAKQTMFDEFTAADFNNGIDFEGGYDGCIERARQALSKDQQP
jgi:hypothetical protein